MSTIRQFTFAGGEISPSLYARTDTVKHQTGLRTCRNGIVMRHGGWTNRPGTQFIGEVNDSTKETRLLEFIFNSSQTYILEFGDLYMRVIKDGAYITDLTLTITGITQANPAVLTYTGTDPSNGQEVYISGVGGMTQVNGRNFKIVNVNSGANTFELDYMDGTNVNSTAFGAYTSGGTAVRIYTLTTPYAEADLFDLKYDQSADVITIASQLYQPRELTRSGDASWTLATISFTPNVSAPTGGSGSPAGSNDMYKITTIKDETFEESLPTSAITCGTADPTPSGPTSLSWNAAANAREYRIYRAVNDVYGFVGPAGGTDFEDIGVTPDVSDTPPDSRNPFNGSTNWPSVVAYIQQRRYFANTPTNPETVYGSRIGFYKNFTISTPIEDDDSVTFNLAGSQVNQVQNIIDLGRFVMMTTDAEWVINGDVNGTVTPTAINAKQISYNGSASLRPIIVNSTAIYLQARRSVVYNLAFQDSSNTVSGIELSLYASHLFDGYTFVDNAYQKIPHSVAWFVRDDGVLLGLTYIPEQEVYAWHRHDFDGGIVESVNVVPEGTEDVLYLIIKRTIDGRTVRYVERMNNRLFDDIEDAIFMDSALTFDGRNTGATTMTLSGGTDWDHDETLTLTASASFFASTDIGNAIHLNGAGGTFVRLEITAYTSATVVTVRPDVTVATNLRSTAITDWAEAVDEVTGLWHLEGEDVSVFADGFVLGSPNNPDYATYTVTNGAITLPEPYSVIHVGLPYISDLQTLDVDSAAAETVADKEKFTGKVHLHLEETRGMWAGLKAPTDDDDDPLEGLAELKIRNEENYNDPVALFTGVDYINLESNWNDHGRVFIRQVDPLPATVLAVYPEGLYPFKTQGRSRSNG